MAAIESTNQTQFSAEQPFFEQPIGLPQEERVVKPIVPFFKRRKTIILSITIVTVVLLFILFVINLIVERNRRLGIAPGISVATPSPIAANNLQLEVEQLKREWKAANPTQLELQPPALDYEIRLDPTVR